MTYLEFRWRREETGEGEIQLGADEELCSLTFSNQGTELSGTFISGLTGETAFSGIKTQSLVRTGTFGPIESDWEERAEQQYEYARVKRWQLRSVEYMRDAPKYDETTRL
jgi:hypothetical protein